MSETIRPPHRWSAMFISCLVAHAKSASVSSRSANGSRRWASNPARDEDQVRAKRFDTRQDRGLERFAKDVPAVARPQRHVHDGVVLATLRSRAGAGIKRHLVRR